MFLLIQIADIMHYDRKYIFTFHNVSINTTFSMSGKTTARDFTFHNVSINTEIELQKSDTAIQLYIPQCFY